MKESKPRQRKKKQETKTTSKTEGEWFILAMLCLYWCHTAPIHTTKSKRRRVQAMSSDDDSEPGDTVTSKHFISSTLLILYVYLNSDILISCICFAQKECRTEWIKCSGKIILAGLALLLMTSVNRNPVMKEHYVHWIYSLSSVNAFGIMKLYYEVVQCCSTVRGHTGPVVAYSF